MFFCKKNTEPSFDPAILRRVEALEASHHRLEHRFQLIEKAVEGVERLLVRLGRRDNSPGKDEGQQSWPTKNELRYRVLENRYRGSEADITAKLLSFVELFKAAPGRVLEIGTGRGELQRLFRDHGIASCGVELDSLGAADCCSEGFDVVCEDVVSYLEKIPDSSLGGAVAIQVIEHLERDYFLRLIELLAKKIRKGGKVLFETVNVLSLSTLAHNYPRDPSHVLPLHPDTVRLLMTTAGLAVEELKFTTPFPEAAQLLPFEPGEGPREKELRDKLNLNFSRLNELLYGFQEYYILGSIP